MKNKILSFILAITVWLNFKLLALNLEVFWKDSTASTGLPYINNSVDFLGC